MTHKGSITVFERLVPLPHLHLQSVKIDNNFETMHSTESLLSVHKNKIKNKINT